jgi:predicted DCC family thiol-disulfide oxidoreductase YuxK
MTPYQFIRPEDFGLTLKDCETALQYVSKGGRVSAGHEGYRQMLIELGGFYLVLGRLMRLPGYYGTANIVYRWIAKNRHKMPGGTPTCSLENR